MIEALILGGLGFSFGVVLVYLARKFEVKVDERLEKIVELLPGKNCGTCGFANCEEMASASLKDPTYLERCRVLEPDNRRKIEEILGVSLQDISKKIAIVACTFQTENKFKYVGVQTCAAAVLVSSGFKKCKYACLGLGDCVRVCPFDAISISEGEVKIDKNKCVGCGLCVQTCPKNVINLVNAGAYVFVSCSSRDDAKTVVGVCKNGCIGCGLCAKACPVGAIKIENNLAIIDYSICTGCGKCAEVCPRKVIFKLRTS
ncbi:MAG: RnfABCDGE type electron transport complex subunit B [Candidatus Hadarchaeales archaeon]